MLKREVCKYCVSIKTYKGRKDFYNPVTKNWQILSSRHDEVPLFKDSSDEKTYMDSPEGANTR